MIGLARVGRSLGVRPFMAARLIKRGRRKGQYQITLTNGRNAVGEVKPGKKIFIHGKQIVEGGGLIDEK